MEENSLNTPRRVEAPGAKGARVCGILAILCAFTCIGIPVAIALGIVALVLHAKAKTRAQQDAEAYTTPSAAGLILGIAGLVTPVVMLPFVGIVSAIAIPALAIPALLDQRERARCKATQANITSRMTDMVVEYDRQREQGKTPSEIRAALEARLKEATAGEKNPYNPAAPAYVYTVAVVSADNPDAVREAAEAKAQTQEPGVAVFVVSFPVPVAAGEPIPGWIAGAAQVKVPVNGRNLISQESTLE